MDAIDDLSRCLRGGNWRRRWLLALLMALVASFPEQAAATHFRFGNLSWEPTGVANQVRFHLTVAYRRDFDFTNETHPGQELVTGDLFSHATLSFGQGSSVNLRFKVTSFSVTDDFIIGEAVDPADSTGQTPGIVKTYTNAGPFTVLFASSARISTLNNRADLAYQLKTIVRLDGNGSPKTTLVPIVTVPESATASFLIPASDPNGDRLQFKVGASTEVGGGESPPKFLVDKDTGVVTWDTRGLNKTNPWTAQIIIEDLDAGGAVRTQTPIDFLLMISALPPPTGTLTPPGPYAVVAGKPLTFTVTGNAANPSSTITINSGGLPPGATTTPALPKTGPGTGTSVTFNWTPTATQVGSFPTVFSITDSLNSQILLNADITVAENVSPGTFSGFVADLEGRLGAVTFRLKADGTFSGTMNLTGVAKYVIKGQLDSANRFNVALADGSSLKGQINAGSFRVEVTNDQHLYDGIVIRSTGRHAPQAGTYTALLPLQPSFLSDPAFPHGTGYAVVFVDALGNFRAVGVLGDGTRFGTGSGIRPDGTAPLFAGLYTGRTGQLQGQLTFQEKTGSVFDGVLNWSKPQVPGDPFYASGFSARINAVGSRYNKPAKQTKMLTLSAAATWNLAFTEGNLSSPLSAAPVIPVNGEPAVLRPLRSLTLGKTTGLFSGYVVHTNGQSKLYRGVVFQKENRGEGFFLGTDRAGIVKVAP